MLNTKFDCSKNVLLIVSSTKFLGVIIDENLTWKNHIDAISKTISRNTGMLTKLKHFVPENILYSLYCTLILPYINYGVLTLVLLRGGCTNPPNGYRPGAQNLTAKG